MTQASTSAVPALILRRRYKAPRERVFEAWTTPTIASTFLGPGDVEAVDVHMDVRPGGRYTITMLRPDGGRWTVTGVYREVAAPQRLSMTWRWQEDDPAEEYDSILTLEFNDVSGETEFVLVHERLATAASRERHEHGWTLIADRLAEVVQ